MTYQVKALGDKVSIDANCLGFFLFSSFLSLCTESRPFDTVLLKTVRIEILSCRLVSDLPCFLLSATYDPEVGERGTEYFFLFIG